MVLNENQRKTCARVDTEEGRQWDPTKPRHDNESDTIKVTKRKLPPFKHECSYLQGKFHIPLSQFCATVIPAAFSDALFSRISRWIISVFLVRVKS